VLVDSNALKRRAYVDVFAARGVPPATVATALAEAADGDRYAVIEHAVRRARAGGYLDGPEPVEALVASLAEAYNVICEAHTSSCPEIAGVSATLASAAKRYALYVVSDTPEEPLRRVVARRGWQPHFRDVLGRPRTKVENLGLVMRRERLRPGQVTVIGDGRRDLDAARHWGCGFMGVESDGNDFDRTGVLMLPDLRRLEAALEEHATC
jgi:phosphoglycolate phosphatase-like HAD superfamily hydrolase